VRFHWRWPLWGFICRRAAIAQEKKITVWWGKGFYKSEDDALLEAIKKFGQDRHQGRTVAIPFRT